MYIVMVDLMVQPDKVQEFISAAIEDASNSVKNEPGCRRFDVIQDSVDKNHFAFTEVYNSIADFEFHKSTPHFEVWSKVSVDLVANDPKVAFCQPVFPRQDANWSAYNPSAIHDDYFNQGSLHVIHIARLIKPECINEFIKAVSLDAIGSTHMEPGCLRFDVYQDIDNPSQIYLYEVYVNPDAFEYHKGTPHIRKWQETVKDMYASDTRTGVVGKNIWPADNWNWSSGKPIS